MNLRAYWRFTLVVTHLLPLVLAWGRDRRRYLLFGPGRRVSPETRRRRARSLLDSLVALGPTFIKLGQLLSTRPDILPPEYIDEFERLQDDVPPADWSDARVVLEDELGPVAGAFDEFDTDPISGASLGQVYVGAIGDQRVAVKVRRPGVEELVAADLRVIRWSLAVILRVVDDARAFSLETLADEFATTIRQEMDYERERRMLEEIRANLADNPRVAVPATIESHSTGRVLTMEFLPGTKITAVAGLDALGVDRSEIAETLQRTYMEMIIEHGVYHADPHPGNLAVQRDGTIVFYDFGMSGYVDPFVQEKIVAFYVAIARQNTDQILDVLIEMGTLSPDADRTVMAEVLELAIADARGEAIEQYRVQQIIRQVEDTMYEFPLRLPSNLALVLRVATVVEGVCVTLDPDFDFITVATDFLREHGYLEASAREYVAGRAEDLRAMGESAVRVPPKLEDALDRVNRGEVTVQFELADDDRALERLARRIVLGGVFAAFVVATAVLVAFGPGWSAGVAAAVAVVALGLLLRSFRRRRGVRATPQFTRQNLRERRAERGEDTTRVSGTPSLGTSTDEPRDTGDVRDATRPDRNER